VAWLALSAMPRCTAYASWRNGLLNLLVLHVNINNVAYALQRRQRSKSAA